MGGYANAGDSQYNETSTNNETRLGGSTTIPTSTEIAILVTVISVVLLAILVVLYCRKLQVRRRIDMANRTRDRDIEMMGPSLHVGVAGEEGSIVVGIHKDDDNLKKEHDDAASSRRTSELGYGRGLGHGAGSSSSSSGQLRGGTCVAPRSSEIIEKPPLWHYFRWKGNTHGQKAPPAPAS